MSYQDFWYGDVEMVKYYREAHKLAIKRRNEELWLQGYYNYNAFAVVLSNAFSKGKKEKYLEKPIDLFHEEKKPDYSKIDAYLKNWQKNWNKLYGNQNK